jgi:hypothetical protein
VKPRAYLALLYPPPDKRSPRFAKEISCRSVGKGGPSGKGQFRYGMRSQAAEDNEGETYLRPQRSL